MPKEGGEEELYSFLSSALDLGGWSMPHAGHITPGKETWYQLYRRPGGTQGQSGQAQKISPPLGLNPQTIQPILLNNVCQS